MASDKQIVANQLKHLLATSYAMLRSHLALVLGVLFLGLLLPAVEATAAEEGYGERLRFFRYLENYQDATDAMPIAQFINLPG